MSDRSLGDHMRARRNELGISQAEAWRRSGVRSRTTWVAWENGSSTPDDHNHVKIERALEWKRGGVSLAQDGKEPIPVPRQTQLLLTEEQQRELSERLRRYLRRNKPREALRLLAEDIDVMEAAAREDDSRAAG